MNEYPAVLYVEDDMMSRMVMQTLLKQELQLANVVIFEDSYDFDTKLDQLGFTPDIIFLDIHVPPLDGFNMLEVLRQRDDIPQGCPIVALTASVMNEEVEQLKTAGFNGVIPKPIDIDTFPGLVERILDGEAIWRIIKK